TPVITSGRSRILVPDKSLHRDDIGAGIKQSANEGASHIMRRECLDAGLGRSCGANDRHGLRCEPPDNQPTTLCYPVKQWSWRKAPDDQPLVERRFWPVRYVGLSILIAFA